MPASHLQIFVSSTFLDFAREREHIARTLPTALRHRLSGRSIEISLVDLRWGLTEAELRESGVVRACLGAIERCSPFFVGFIGDRYGNVPVILPEDYDAHPWLRGLEGKSITELEILHGVINAKNTRAVFIDRSSHGEPYDPRVQHLRSLIASSGAPVLRGMVDVDAMLAFIEEHLARVIEESVPETEDSLAALLAQHGTSYFGRYEAVAKLSNLLDGDDPVVWIFGASGAGKSALLAQALAQMPRFQGQRLAIATFPDDADLGLLQEALATTWSALYPSDHHDCAGAMDIREFRARLDKAAAAAVVNNETIALVWDNAPSHRWTDHPADLFNLPTNVRLVVTSRDPPPKAKGLAAFHVPMPTINEISEFLTGRLSSLGRRFPDPVLRELLQATGIRDYRHRSRPASHCPGARRLGRHTDPQADRVSKPHAHHWFERNLELPADLT